MFRLLEVLWHKLDGNKTLIGLLLLQIESFFTLPDVWWVAIIKTILYFWTGVGATHKLVKYGRNKK